MLRLLSITALLLSGWVTAIASPRAAAAASVTVHEDILWAEPGGVPLTLDIYVPSTARASYPVVVIYHGGGWLLNDNSIMDSAARYLAEEGEFVVANMNYRLLGDNGNTTRMNEIIEDALGGLLWVKAHIEDYGGDPRRVAVTGDSAGAHLAAMILMAGQNLSGAGFGAGKPGFDPTYLPDGKTVGQVQEEDGLAVQAAVLSYGAFDLYREALDGFETSSNGFWEWSSTAPRSIFGGDVTPSGHPELYRAVSPIYLVPPATERRLPPTFVHVGSEDRVTPPAAIQKFVDRMRAAGQPIEFRIYDGKRHAFLDSGCNEYLGNCFDKDAPDTLDDIIAFLREHLRST
ncbi:alpha/beta hydrolase [Microbulbifer sediminum]|uniref:alpha/beta hydrolase n=1 Tax=Microbulbifer sediminum TaxID=2904250 RepID=UPI001F423486|nr:alpha/beta hydrolase [Microbulbifer sediminum]